MVYLPGLHGPFLFDDFSNLPRVQVNSLDPVELKDAALTNTSGRLRRPVANLSFALNGYWGGPGPLTFKIVNLLIHLVCGLLVFLIVRRICLIPAASTHRLAQIAAVVAAAFWLLHPIQVSTVLYVVQRMAQLSTLFAFLAVLGWLRWRMGLEKGNWWRSLGWLALVGLSSLLSLLSKESGALIPLLLLILEGALFQFRAAPGKRAQAWTVNGLLVALPLSLGAFYVLTHWPSFEAGYATRPFTMGERLLTEIHALWHYLRLIFVPDLGAMGLYYDHFPMTRSLDALTLLKGLGLASLFGLAIAVIRRQPIFSLGILWFFAAHAMESTFIALEPAFEHRNYLPLLGPAMIVGWYLPAIISRAGEARRLAVGGIAIVALVVTGLTYARAESWSSRLSFLQTQMRHHPTSFRVNLDLVNGAMQAQNWVGALERIEAIRQNKPDNPAWPFLRLFVACGRGDLPDIWLDEASATIKTHGVSKEVVLSIQALTGRKVKRICPAISFEALHGLINEAIEDPIIHRSGAMKSLLLLQRARLNVLDGNLPSAASSYQAAWRANPKLPTPLLDLAYLQIALGQFSEADETIQILQSVVDDSPLAIGETWVDDLRERLRRERVSSKSSE